MNAAESPRAPRLSPVLIHLLRGVLYRDQHPIVWNDLLALQAAAMDFMTKLALELHVDEAEGYAYLSQSAPEEGEDVPRLIQRRPLSYHVSLLCALLRKRLVEGDAGGEMRVVMTRRQLVDMMRQFSPARSNEVAAEEQLDGVINRVADMGFLKPMKGDPPAFEIRRILKALVDADWLARLEETMRNAPADGQ